jgi:putative nucleotidyltransferase with HDIG domain
MRLAIKVFVAMVASVAAFLFAMVTVEFGFDFRSYIVFTCFALVITAREAPLRIGAVGQVGFIAFIPAALVVSPGVGAAVAFTCSTVNGIRSRAPAIKLIFNASQQMVAVLLSWWVYSVLGGSTPPIFASFDSPGAFGLLEARDAVLFIACTLTYLAVNQSLVAAAVSISDSRAFWRVFRANTKGVLGFDLLSNAIAVLVVIAYQFAALRFGTPSIGLVLVAVPVIISRKSYLLYRQQQQSGEELLQLMVKAIEARDPYTSGHSVRVQRLSMAIAADLGMNEQDLENVAAASLLHDVGKIHEEFAAVLRKEGKLTDEERRLIESHAERGAELVGVISRFRGIVQESVRHHHERWDGRGYPEGLAGEDVPRISRVILVADTIDAMTTDRPYRSKLPLESVIAELRRHSGTQFDPRVVEVATTSLAVRRAILSYEPTGNRQASMPMRAEASNFSAEALNPVDAEVPA